MAKARGERKSLLPAELRRRAFVDAYCGPARYCAAQAAAAAGYQGKGKVLSVRGATLLARPDVQEMIRERQILAQSHSIADAREVLIVLTQHLRGSMDDFTTFDVDGNVVVDVAAAKHGKKMGLVKKFEFNEHEVTDALGEVVGKVRKTRIELYDVQKAGEILLKARGVIGKDPVQLAPSTGDDTLDSRRQAMIDKLQAAMVPFEAWPPRLQEFHRANNVVRVSSTAKDVPDAATG